MKALIVTGVILVLLLLLSLVRVGGIVDYSAAGLVVRLRLGAFRFTLFPLKPRKKKPKMQKEKPPAPPKPTAEPAKKEGGSLDLLKQFLPLVADAAGKFKRKIRIDRLDLDLTVACPDPADAAMAYGGANAILGMVVPLLEHNFNVKERKIHTALDFDRTSPAVALTAAVSMTIGQGAALTLTLGFRALTILMNLKKQTQSKQKEAV